MKWGSWTVIFESGFVECHKNTYESVMILKNDLSVKYAGQIGHISKIIFTFGVQDWVISGKDAVDVFLKVMTEK